MSDEGGFVINFIEQAVRDYGVDGNPIRPLFSIAISLRRIADSLDRMDGVGGTTRHGGGTSGKHPAAASLERAIREARPIELAVRVVDLENALREVLPYTTNEGTRIVNDVLGLNDDKPRSY